MVRLLRGIIVLRCYENEEWMSIPFLERSFLRVKFHD